MSKSVVRTMKNVTKGYSSVQVKVRNATSNDSWGPSGTDMSDIAQMTFNSSGDFSDIMEMIDKRLNDKGKNWRHVLKSLKLLDYCLHEGSEMVVTWARKNIYIIKTLREFQYIDEDGRDVGQNVRTSAKELSSLIMDEDRLRAERHDRKLWKTRVTGLDDLPPPVSQAGGSSSSRVRRNPDDRRSRQTDEDDLEFRLAIEASKNEAEEDKKRREKSTAPATETDDDLAKALKLSKEEEELRRNQLEQSNAISLFDDTPAQPSQPQATGWNQGYQQQGAVDWFGNPVDQQQPQSTGFLNNAYAQPTSFQPQQTGFQNPYGNNPYQAPQQTGFDASQFQQQQYIQPQQTSFNMNNPYSQQAGGFGDQFQQQPLEPQNTMQPGSHNPWASNSDGMDSLKAQPTGSNNPFAAQVNRAQPAQAQRFPTLDTLQEQKTQSAFNSFQSQRPAQAPQPQQNAQTPQNPHHAQLNALLASGEGQDTFGNVGNLRIPAQHTAPGAFINSYGQGSGRLQTNQTGANPYLQNKFTGMPSQGAMQPAQTGYGGGYGSSNPFGGQQQQPQQRQGGGQSQGGSLIDL